MMSREQIFFCSWGRMWWIAIFEPLRKSRRYQHFNRREYKEAIRMLSRSLAAEKASKPVKNAVLVWKATTRAKYTDPWQESNPSNPTHLFLSAHLKPKRTRNYSEAFAISEWKDFMDGKYCTVSSIATFTYSAVCTSQRCPCSHQY